jgi:hypothetical protein
MIGLSRVCNNETLETLWVDDAGQQAPTTWIPKPANPSKLIEHVWDGERWHATPFARFVPLKRKLADG